MSEPTNRELMVHLEYLRKSSDEQREMLVEVTKTTGDHASRLATLEERTPKQAGIYGAAAGLFATAIAEVIKAMVAAPRVG